MNINVSLDGYTEGIVKDALAKGIVKTKAEAIRFALLLFGREYKLENINIEEVKMVNKKIEQEIKEVENGNVKLSSWEKVKSNAGI